MAKVLLTEKEVADLLSITVTNLKFWRSIGYGPKHVNLSKGCQPRYRLKDINKFVERL